MVFLLHFDRGYKHARHYIGATDDPAHLYDLAHGTVPLVDVPLLNAARQAGVRFTVACTWLGGDVRAAQLRAMGGAARLCRCCVAEARAEEAS